ncbi:MAG: dienelactone hydrolase family protein, partial [Lentisphaeria bacterium]|nr:dienelactone hydrolase family protein [Lentisphaeria bacterium]
PSVHFGRHLVQQGYVVVCGQAFPYNTVPDPQSDAGFAWWHAGTTKLLGDNPEWTGMGKLVHDTRIATDFLLDQPGVDAERLVAIGHSLGGKMAFYSGCLDERVRAIVSSDFGIGFDFTNWDAPWYLGDWVRDPNPPVEHHELLALHAPNPFLVLAGDADRLETWQYLEAARPAYELLGAPEALSMLHHATGHRPPVEVTRTAYVWLAEQFGLPEVSYKI